MKYYDRDRAHLNILGIVSYVVAGLNLIGAILGGGLNLLLGFCAMNGAFPLPLDAPLPPQEFTLSFEEKSFGFLLILSGGIGLVLQLAAATIAFLNGRWLRQQRHRTLCVLIAVLQLPLPPVGTAIGVLTLIVLYRPTVKEMFARNCSNPAPGA